MSAYPPPPDVIEAGGSYELLLSEHRSKQPLTEGSAR